MKTSLFFTGPGPALSTLAPLLCLLLTLPVVAPAQDFTYTTNDGTITITRYTGPGGDATIPDAIDGLPVTTIAEQAFCNSTALTTLTVGSNITTIGDSAFRDCTGLTRITIAASVTRIGERTFGWCYSLTAIEVDPRNSAYSSLDGVLFNKTQTTLLQCPGGKAGSYTIPDRVTTVGNNAFYYCTSLTNLTIPNSVTTIWGSALYGCTNLTRVSIGNRVTTIGDYAFSGCTSLTNVIIPDSVTTIWNSAFRNCDSLTAIEVDPRNAAYSSLDGVLFNKTRTTLLQCPGGKAGRYTIPDRVTTIGDYAFARCTSLTRVTIPGSVTNIERGAFTVCTSLTGIEVGPLNSAYSSLDGVLFNKTQTVLVRYPGGKAGSHYTIPDRVTTIGDGAFSSCTRLATVTLGNHLTSIENGAFWSCTRLSRVTIPDRVTTIGEWAFRSCTGLTNLTIGDGVTTVEDTSFSWCTNLTRVTIGSRVTTIGDTAFGDSASLTAIEVDPLNSAYSSLNGVLFNKTQTLLIQYPRGKAGSDYAIPNSVTGIGDKAFNSCTRLATVTLGNHVTSIERGAFWSCARLTAIEVDPLNSAYSSLDGVLFNKTQTLLLQYPRGKAGSDYTIPDTVTTIGGAAFHGCTSLTNITIPDSVVTIGGHAFTWCTNLASVTIGNGVTTIEEHAFFYCTSLTGVYLKGNAPTVDSCLLCGNTKATVYYLPGTAGWGTTFGGRPTALWRRPGR